MPRIMLVIPMARCYRQAEVERISSRCSSRRESVSKSELASKRGPLKFQKDMAQSMEDVSTHLGEMMKQFVGAFE